MIIEVCDGQLNLRTLNPTECSMVQSFGIIAIMIQNKIHFAKAVGALGHSVPEVELHNFALEFLVTKVGIRILVEEVNSFLELVLT